MQELREAEAGGLQVQGQPGQLKSCLKTTTTTTATLSGEKLDSPEQDPVNVQFPSTWPSIRPTAN